VPLLKGGESYRTRVTFRALASGEEVENAAGAISRLQQAAPEVQILPMPQQ
jgi:hypothetical protein